ncbi:MAG TPA: FdhF/YdeP family oxidoreductase [Flavobacteriales bacterium]|nr:FdhF/YdeP family oxidoreductase [Flavobacteriales bacterium]
MHRLTGKLHMNKRDIALLPPDTHTGLTITDRKTWAAGLPALTSSLAHLHEETGVMNGISILNKLNQKDGFDCPGCAWPDPDRRSHLGEYCENGVKAIAEEATTKRVDRAFFAQHSVEELSRWSDYEIGKAGRLTEPFVLRRNSSHYEPIGWDEAFRMVGDKLRSLPSPNEAIFYTSGRASNEAAYLYQLFVRQFGTNNLPDCSNMCHESSGTGLGETIGIGKGTVSLQDIHEAKLVLVMGQNPGTNHPRMLSALEKCKGNGGTIVSINPLPEAGTMAFRNPQEVKPMLFGASHLADRHIPIRGTMDVAFLKGVLRLMLDQELAAPGTVFDQAFIAEKTAGYDAFIADLHTVDPQTMADRCGLHIDDLRYVADAAMRTDRIIVCWAMGLTQHTNAVDNIQQVVNLLLLRGAFGKPGAGACPVRGHSNVQGDRTMGIYEKPGEAFLSAMDKRYQFTAPRAHGHDVVEAIEAMRDGSGKVFIALGGNFISATPDSEVTSRAVMRTELTVQISTKLSRSHLITGAEALILPCYGRSERDIAFDTPGGKPRFVTVEDSMSVVHRSQGAHEPASPHLRSEPEIIAGIAQATLGERPNLRWREWARDYDLIRDEVEAVIPGFTDFNKRVRKPDGFVLPNGPRDGAAFSTPSGKGHFSVTPAPEWKLKQGEYMAQTLRTHDQFNTTIYGLDDRYRGLHGERRVVLMHADDMAAEGLRTKDRVDLVSHYGRERVATDFFVVPYEIARGCVATYFPEANVLVPLELRAAKSGTPASKGVVITLRKH